jgi:hypothetical protein
MRKYILTVIMLLNVIFFYNQCGSKSAFEFVQGDQQIDIYVADNHFTSYVYDSTLTKPVLWPIKSPDGTVMTRAFPFKKIKGENHDHPHHTGLFFTYDKVNDVEFWNNTTSPPRIKHIELVGMEKDLKRASMTVRLHWIDTEGHVLLEENREMIFSVQPNQYNIEFTIKLIAMDTTVVFKDTKEGMFGIRVAPWLKEKGRDSGTAIYTSSNGDKKEEQIWGKRAEWVDLRGEKNGNSKGVTIMNHPSSVNYPTFWHARGYGLFAANPLGQAVFQKSRKADTIQPLNFTLVPKQSGVFKFKVTIYDGSKSAEEINQAFQEYANPKY